MPKKNNAVKCSDFRAIGFKCYFSCIKNHVTSLDKKNRSAGKTFVRAIQAKSVPIQKRVWNERRDWSIADAV